MARVGDERAPDLAPELGPDRDVLEIGIAAAQPPGGGDRLVEAGVDAPGVRIDELRQGVDVPALELHQAAPVDDEPRHLVYERQLPQPLARRAARLRPPGSMKPFRLQR